MLHNPWYHLIYAAVTDSVLRENTPDKAVPLKYLYVQLQIRLFLAKLLSKNIYMKQMRDYAHFQPHFEMTGGDIC